jgi:hypothetical protein
MDFSEAIFDLPDDHIRRLPQILWLERNPQVERNREARRAISSVVTGLMIVRSIDFFRTAGRVPMGGILKSPNLP